MSALQKTVCWKVGNPISHKVDIKKDTKKIHMKIHMN